MSSLGIKFDSDKLQLRLLPWGALEEVGKVVTYGAIKYAPDNWKYVKPFEDRYTDATLRHLVAYLQGEVIDPESGLNHLAHAAANLLFLIEGGVECQSTSSPVTPVIQKETPMNTGKLTEESLKWIRHWNAPNVEDQCEESGDFWVSNSTEPDLQGAD